MKKTIFILLSVCIIACANKEVATHFYSWASLTSTQAVAFGDANDAVSTGVFYSKTSITSSTQTMTKADASTYLFIDSTATSFAALASNQLVTKADLVPMAVQVCDNYVAGDNSASPYPSIAFTKGAYCGGIAFAGCTISYFGSSLTPVAIGLKLYASHSGRYMTSSMPTGIYMLYFYTGGAAAGAYAVTLDSAGTIIAFSKC